MLHVAPAGHRRDSRFVPHIITIRRDEAGYGIRFGLTEAEDELMHGPVFETLDEALSWIDAADRARLDAMCHPDPAARARSPQIDALRLVKARADRA